MMKKLLLVVITLTAVSNAEALFGSRCGNGRCGDRKERQANSCADKSYCNPISTVCQRNCTNNVCEAPKPNICALVPAPVHLIENVHTEVTKTYECAGRTGCQVAPTQAQVEELIAGGFLAEGSIACH